MCVGEGGREKRERRKERGTVVPVKKSLCAKKEFFIPHFIQPVPGH